MKQPQLVQGGHYIQEKAYFGTAVAYDTPEAAAELEAIRARGVAPVTPSGRLYRFVEKNRVRAADRAEILSPGRTGKPFFVGELYDTTGCIRASIPHPEMVFWARVPHRVESETLCASEEADPHRFIKSAFPKKGIPHMNTLIELLKSLLFGIVEGVTEWLPISSTGHLILLNELVGLNVSDEFWSMFEVVIQLGAILAVIVLFFHKLNPFAPSKSAGQKKETRILWLKVILSIIPSGLVGILLDDWMDAPAHPDCCRRRTDCVRYCIPVSGKAAPAECFQCESRSDRSATAPPCSSAASVLALIPGTSRSGSTILGAMLLGLSRAAAAEFSFFMAIPTMIGASGIKALKFVLSGTPVSGTEWGVLAVGFISAFLVSLAAIRFLMDFVKKHTFSAFGWYRIALGLLVLVWFFLIR